MPWNQYIVLVLSKTYGVPYNSKQGLREGGLSGTSVRCPESQKGTCESLKDPIALGIDDSFLFFFTFCVVLSAILLI